MDSQKFKLHTKISKRIQNLAENGIFERWKSVKRRRRKRETNYIFIPCSLPLISRTIIGCLTLVSQSHCTEYWRIPGTLIHRGDPPFQVLLIPSRVSCLTSKCLSPSSPLLHDTQNKQWQPMIILLEPIISFLFSKPPPLPPPLFLLPLLAWRIITLPLFLNH